jgi:hypothetical protein
MTDFVDALEQELRRAAERRARGRGRARRWARPRPRRLLPALAAVVALGIGLAVVLAVRPAGEARRPPATAPATTPPPIPADVSPGARRSKRFGLGERVATSSGVPVYADIDRWRYCPRDPRKLNGQDLSDAAGAVLAIVGRLTALDTFGARAGATLVTGTDYGVHQCGTKMRGHAADVAVLLPQVKSSASLSQLDLVVARTRSGWVVFDRRH